MGKIIHPTIRAGTIPARKNTHPPNENGGKKAESFSNDRRESRSERNRILEDLFGEPVGFFIWLSLLNLTLEVDMLKAQQF